MENAVEAMKLAFSIMIFVFALSISISGFTQARLLVDTIIDNKALEESYIKDADGNYLNYLNFAEGPGGTRTVGVDTIVSTMYRAYKENFKIYFYNIESSANCNLQSFEDENNETVYYIDLEKETFANTEEAYKYLDNILSNTGNKFYKYLSNNKFTEKLGEYYQEDEEGITDIAEVNKNKKRVIIYIKQ